MRTIPRLSSMTIGLAIAITAAVAAVSAGGAWIYAANHSARLLDNARATALAQGQLVRRAPGRPADSAREPPPSRACHQYAPAERASSRVIDTAGGAVLRTVVPV